MDRIADILVAHRRGAAVVGLVILVALLLPVRLLPIDGSLAGFDVPDNPHRTLAESMSDRFPPPPVIQIAIEPAGATYGELVADLHAIDTALVRVVPGSEVGSLHSFDALFDYAGIQERDPIDDALAFARRAPVARDLLSRDGRSFLMLVRAPVEPRPDPAQLEEILARPYTSIAAARVFSLGHLERDVRTAIVRDVTRLTLLIALGAIVCVVLAYRSLAALVFIGALTGAATIGALSVQAALSQSLDIATMLVVPTILVLSLADGVHLLTGFARPGEHGDAEERLRFTLRHYLTPSLLTSVTTAGAFFSLLLAEASSLRALGAGAGLSVLVAFVLAYLLGPYLLDVLRVRPAASPRLLAGVASVAGRAPAVGAPLLLLIPLAVILLPRLNFSTPPDHFFPANSETTRVHDEITDRFYALSTIDVLLTPTDPVTAAGGAPSMAALITGLSTDLEDLPGVYAAVSVGDVITEGRGLGIPAPVLVGLALDNPYTATDGTAYRIEVRVDEARRIPELAERVEGVLAGRLSRGEWAVTGITLALEYVNGRVVRTLLASFALSTLFVVLVIVGLTRSARGTVVALVANLVPIAAAAVAFALLGLELSVLSASVLVLSMGLIVDDTMHVVFRLVRDGGDLGELPYGMVVTSLVVSAGFAAFLASSFPPIRILGGAIAGVLSVALVADLTLVPWLYRGVSPPSGRGTPVP